MKKLLYLIIIFVIVGMWLGLNFANNQPFFSNPFADKEVAARAEETAKAVQREVDQVVEDVFDKTLKNK